MNKLLNFADMEQTTNKGSRIIELCIHLIGWGIVLASPWFFMNKEESHRWSEYLHHVGVPLAFCAVFYMNYLILIPRLLFKDKVKEFFIANILLIAIVSYGVNLWQSMLFIKTFPPHEFHHMAPPRWMFFLRDVTSMVLVVGMAAAIKMSRRWHEAEAARSEAERNQTEAELKNLRSQLNPHFLLNTLNNIYALIAFNSDKAQMAVEELSKLLRHVLYDNQQTYVSLGKEMDFIRNYIELMRIRLASNVEVETDIDIDADSRTQIAPLIYISLIENAFKHGISPTEPSFIRILFSESEKEVRCEIVNSYHPKSVGDKSGSGIGLEQVKKRLELIYPDRYQWEKGVTDDKKEYYSRLTIQTNV